ncbi:GGDEF domain-containing protein [Methylobacterium sp. BTF04]|uniref:GGDEF domain-containing protein n=1 Tax=Methylobacterium sp. BTF04 TaxID=2708300 RepID=UPI0013D6DEBD|nr:GGDEF domain-containing protein [Methylobacterium sp. BTF04]NEU14996.1 GGDEF domain-containing protein [Methylobacterium sp. BTF04]
MGTFEPAIEGGPDNKAALLKEVEATLDAGTFGVRFTKIIEENFNEATKAPRAAFFIRLAIVGTIIYNLFLFLDAIIVPDVIRELIIMQLAIATPITCFCILAIGLSKIDTNYATMISVTAMLICTLAAFIVSRAEHVGLYGCLFCLFMTAVNVAQAWSFRWALTLTAVTNIAVTIAAVMHPSLDTPTRIFIIILLASASHYSLVGNYRIDSSVRRAYLFALRESLRASLLDESNVQLTILANLDGLTGIGNRRYFDKTLAKLWTDQEDRREIALLLLDIDHFKRLNDTHGHQAGDVCLQQVARCLAEQTVRRGQIVARYGGEEFALILADTNLGDAFYTAEEVRGAIEALVIYRDDGTALKITVSIGCASITPHADMSYSEIVAAADAALYIAKNTGRNRTKCAELGSINDTINNILISHNNCDLQKAI